MIRKFFFILLFTFTFPLFPFPCLAQDDLMNLFDNNTSKKPDYVYATFKSTRIVNGQSIENPANGDLIFMISHHFGKMNQGAYELFGLDQSTIRFGLEYGFNKRLSVGFGRSSFEKTYDGSLKYIILRQSKGIVNMPVSVSLFTDMTVNSLKWQYPDRKNYFTSRLAFVYELLIARKFNNNLSLQLTPAVIHNNLVALNSDQNDLYAVGGGGRYKITQRLSVNAEYFYLIPGRITGNPKNSLSFGVDIETGGHVFQFYVTNSQPMFDRAFISETQGSWNKGDIHIGFNISRTFTVDKSKKSKRWQ